MRPGRRLAWLGRLLIVLIIAPHCASVRHAEQTTVALRGGGGIAIDRRHGCEGERLSEETHRQATASFRVRHRTHRGLIGGGGLSWVRGRLARSSGEPVVPGGSPYQVMSATAFAGFEGTRAAIDVGAEVAISNVNGDVLPLGFAALRAGRLDEAWFELSLGSEQAAHDVRLFGVGFGVLARGFELRLGGALGGVLFARQIRSDHSLGLAAVSEGEVDPFAYLDLTWAAGGAVDVVVHARLGRAPAGTVGVRLRLQDLTSAPAPPPEEPSRDGDRAR